MHQGCAEAVTDGPSVTVVIPVKDDAEILAACLRGLHAQTVPPDEIVIVDNGSCDGSSAVAAAFGARVVYRPGGGIPRASAAGYDEARCDVIARLDADCVAASDWIESVRDSLQRRPAVGAVTGGAAFYDGPRPLRRALAFGYLGAYFAVLTITLGHPPLFGSNFAMRRTAWTDVAAHIHRFDEEVHDDLDLAFHLGSRHRIRYEQSMRMRMSMRPFTGSSSFLWRARRGMHTVIIHWPKEFPPVRWMRLMITSLTSLSPVRRRCQGDGREASESAR